MMMWPEEVAPRRDLWPAVVSSRGLIANRGLAHALAVYGTLEDADLCIVLSSSVGKSSLVEDSLHCLAHIQTPKTLDRLVFLADHGSDGVRWSALDVLPLLEDPHAAKAFERNLTLHSNSLSVLHSEKPSWGPPLLRRLALDAEHSHSRSALDILLSEPVITPELALMCLEALEDSGPDARLRSEVCFEKLKERHLTENSNSSPVLSRMNPSWWPPLLRRLALDAEHSHSPSALYLLLSEAIITPDLALTCVEALEGSGPDARLRSRSCLYGLRKGHPELKDREAREAALRAIASLPKSASPE